MKAEFAEREVRSIAYHIKFARFPAYNDLSGLDFAVSGINEAIVLTLHRCEFMEDAHNVVLIGGPGTFEARGFQDRLGLLADRAAADREARRLNARLKSAALRQVACTEDIELNTPRGMDRAVMAQLVDGGWIDLHENLLTTGPIGLGKSWISCALGHKACRDARSVIYHRVHGCSRCSQCLRVDVSAYACKGHCSSEALTIGMHAHYYHISAGKLSMLTHWSRSWP